MKYQINSTSFFKETIRNHKWIILVLSLLDFVLYPALLILSLTQFVDRAMSIEDITWYMANYFAYDERSTLGLTSFGVALLMVSLLVGVVSGILAFAYLHSKRQVALYHSIPVSREKILFTRLASYTVSFLIPLLVANAAMILIFASRGFLTVALMKQILVMLYYHMMFFWIGYFLAAIAMLLTGKIFVGVLGVGVFIGYFPALATIFSMYQQEFFYHYYSGSGHYMWGSFEQLARISPVIFIECIQWNNMVQWGIVLITMIVLGGLHYGLMKIRPSETAGKSMAYKSVGIIIQVFLLFMATTGLGIFTHISFYGTTWYLYFGGLFGLIATYIILQLLYGVEFKQLLQMKLLPILVGVISLLFMIVIQFDLLGYNACIPEYDDIVDMNIEFTEANQYSTGYIEEGLYEAHMGKNESTYALVEVIVESSANVLEENYSRLNALEVYVEYRLENGKVIQKTYYPAIADISEDLKELWYNEEFLNIMYPIRTQDVSLASKVYLNVISKNNMNQLTPFENDLELQIEFMEAYQKDALEIDITTIDDIPIGSFDYRLEGPVFTDYYSVFIYPSFENTIAFLEENEIDLFSYSEADEIASVEIYDIGNIEEDTAWSEENSTIYTDTDSIAVLLDDMVVSNLVTIFTEVDESKSVDVILKDDSMLTYFMLD